MDVLVYTSDILDDDVEVTGPVELMLYAASDGVDTEFMATLIDVHLSGTAINICEGSCNSVEEPTPIQPGDICAYRTSPWPDHLE
jgi:uncharacterized protein